MSSIINYYKERGWNDTFSYADTNILTTPSATPWYYVNLGGWISSAIVSNELAIKSLGDFFSTADNAAFAARDLNGVSPTDLSFETEVTASNFALRTLMLRESTAAGSKFVAFRTTSASAPWISWQLRYRTATGGGTSLTSAFGASNVIKLTYDGTNVRAYSGGVLGATIPITFNANLACLAASESASVSVVIKYNYATLRSLSSP